MRKHTCHLDLRQRSLYDTVTIGPEGLMMGYTVEQQPVSKLVQHSFGEARVELS